MMYENCEPSKKDDGYNKRKASDTKNYEIARFHFCDLAIYSFGST